MTEGNGTKGGRPRLEGRDVLAAARRVTMSSTLADLRKEWAGLDERTQSRLETLLFRTPIVLGVVSLALLGVMVSNLGGTVIHLVARTEYIRYTPLGNDPPQWLLRNATITTAAPTGDLEEDDFFPSSDETSSEGKSGDDAMTPDEASAGASGGKDDAAEPEPAPVTGDTVIADGFDGFFQPHCGDTIVVSRIGEGPLHIRVGSDRDPVITDMLDKQPAFSRAGKKVGRTFTFTIPASPDGEATGSGASLVWPLEGRVDPGRAVGAQTTWDFGLLLEGRVEVVAGRVGSNSTYTVDGHDLELGDQVRLPTSYDLDRLVREIDEEQRAIDAKRRARTPGSDATPAGDDGDVPTLCRAFDDSKATGSIDKGFIHPDGGKGVHVSLSSNARYADILRYRTAPIQVRSGWFKRLGGDPVIAFGWAVIGVVFLFYRKIARLIVIVAGEMKRKREGADTR